MSWKIGLSPTHTWITVQFQYFQHATKIQSLISVHVPIFWRATKVDSANFKIFGLPNGQFWYLQLLLTSNPIPSVLNSWKYWNWTVIHVWVGEIPIFKIISKCNLLSGEIYKNIFSNHPLARNSWKLFIIKKKISSVGFHSTWLQN